MVSQATVNEIFRQLLQEPENQTCFDCNRLGVGWTSVSHGIFLCQECATIHRSLGVHISFVRSVNMDSWTVKQLKYMSNGGNKQFKEFLSNYNIPTHPVQFKYQTEASRYYRYWLKSREEESQVAENAPNSHEGSQLVEFAPAYSKASNLPTSQQYFSSSNYEPQKEEPSGYMSTVGGWLWGAWDKSKETLSNIKDSISYSTSGSQTQSWSSQQSESTAKEKIKEGATYAVQATAEGAKYAFEKTKEYANFALEKTADVVENTKISEVASGAGSWISSGFQKSKQGLWKLAWYTGLSKTNPNEEESQGETDIRSSFSKYTPPSEYNSYR